MTVVVTGAAGHLGGNLVRALVAQGRRVRAVDRTRDWRPLDGLDVERVEGDICDLDFVRRALGGAEAVYHTAGYISLRMDEWPQSAAVNVTGVANVVQACLANGVRRLIHFSSIHALTQEPFDQPVDEARPLVAADAPNPPYDRSKAAGEREVRGAVAQGLDAVILNPTGIIGPHDYRPSFFGRVLLAMGRGAMPALVDAGFDWVDVRDVVEGAMRAEAQAPAGARYILSGQWVSVPALAALLEEITGRRPPRLVAPLWLAQLAAVVAAPFSRRNAQQAFFTPVSLMALRSNRHISHARVTHDLGYQPRPFRETLHDTFRWFAEAGLLAAAR
ncbi:MAG TPA: NAD-dependent epimerase/dehydratase family protein [Anaerolineae bacterium]|mgnify:CR=1 FL=1|nr:NAD-dependent epimerase/dehydratase family protein [Anaerolineae bacterium]HOQ99591.1 NAD-dependent epimerase/dehydratase family protein [Anaerolineae bacterium]HPL30389.1 NAD-dependent epimerase/dehydratase family protein [Anaerolineae bacterium]